MPTSISRKPSFAIGNVSLGATLVVGFMIHNVTEGFPIITPLAKQKASIVRVIPLGLLAGIPAIVGTLIGGYAYSVVWSIFFLGVGTGAIFQVAIEIGMYVGGKSLNRLFSPYASAGFFVGLIVMYATGLVIAG